MEKNNSSITETFIFQPITFYLMY